MPERTEREKMLAGELYRAADPELEKARARARRLIRLLNGTTEDELEERRQLLDDLIGQVGQNLYIEPPFYCDYGSNLRIGNGVYVNFDCAFLDCNTIDIGDGVLFGPAVQLYAAYHPTDPEERRTGLELAAPIRIGNNVWMGGGAIVCPGVTIGDDTTIGAGSVVTRDVPARVVAAGNPCRVIRRLQ